MAFKKQISSTVFLCATVLLLIFSASDTLSADQPNEVEFTRHVLPVFSKLGCNSGACHGALAGKGGFKLSLDAYNPLGDHFSITRQSKGRRIEMAEPGRSLILSKPTGALPHKGGLLLDPDSRDYEIIATWISRGARAPADDDATLESLAITPQQASLGLDQELPLTVTATYSDGRIEDVTPWARFTSSNLPVVTVGKSGVANVAGHGEAAVVVWFSSRLAVAKIQVPYDNAVDAEAFAVAPRRNFIDELNLAKLQSLRLPPSPRCDDATFIRRAFLDCIGVLPTVEEVEQFAGDESGDKRDALIEALLQRDEYVDYWTYRWSDVFLINGRRLRPPAVKAYYTWLKRVVAENRPWNEVVTEVVTAKGSSLVEGATNFYALHQSPEEMAENVSQAFMGLSIGCAKCHNHPLEKWTNDQYYSLANMFARVRAKGWGDNPRDGDGLRTIFLATAGELDQPLTGKPQPPAPLDGQPLEFGDPVDRRIHLAKWLTSVDNPYFSRSVANRIWANFMGRGLVESVDDMRLSNPASNEPLLAALANYVEDENFNLKSLMRVIMQSETYQRSGDALPGNVADDRFYARYFPRRMIAEKLLDAISQVSKIPTEFKIIEHGAAETRDTEEYPLGTRAMQLYDSAVVSRFLATFGRNSRDIVCECERTNKPSMVQVLNIANGVTINEKLSNENSCVKSVLENLAGGESLESIVNQAYLVTLSRPPNPEELEGVVSAISIINDADTGADQKHVIIEDLYWSLMSSREFLFQH